MGVWSNALFIGAPVLFCARAGSHGGALVVAS